MAIPHKTLQSGFSMPSYGMGTWQMGGMRVYDQNNDDEADIAAIKAAIDRGVYHIDTAEIYADGHSEKLIARAITGYDRSKLFLSSKAYTANIGYNDILYACEHSLKRLQTDYIDLYMPHGYNPGIPLADTMRALDKLVSDGLIRNIGVSNFGAPSLLEAQNLTDNQIVYDQVHYNLEFREPERKGLLEYCQKNDVLLAAWRPVGKGVMLETLSPVVQEMCDTYDKTPVQIAINWLISQDNVITLSKTRSLYHLKENLGALGWTMKPDDIERLRKEFPDQKDLSDVVQLGGALTG